MPFNIASFREFIKTKEKFASMYANELTSFADNNFRKKVFQIKSDLTKDGMDDKVYLPINFARAITSTYTNTIIGKGIQVQRENEDITKKFITLTDKNKLQITLNALINSQSSIGYAIARVRKTDDGKVRIEHIPVTNYSANMDGLTIGDSFEDIKEHYIFSVITDSQSPTKNKLYVDRYTKENGVWKGYFGEVYSYDANRNFTNRLEEAKKEEILQKLPIFLFNNDLENPHIVTKDKMLDKIGNIPRYFNQSDYVDLAPLFEEINDRTSQISIEFIKNLTSMMSVPASYAGTKGANALKPNWDTEEPKSTRIKKLVEKPDYIIHEGGEQPATYIVKDSSYINTSIKEYLPLLFRLVSSISSVPTVFLGLDALIGNNPVGTTEKEFEGFYNRVSKKQQMIYSTLQAMFVCMLEFSTNSIITEYPTIKFPKVEIFSIEKNTDIAERQMNM
jgi:flavodoxin